MVGIIMERNVMGKTKQMPSLKWEEMSSLAEWAAKRAGNLFRAQFQSKLRKNRVSDEHPLFDNNLIQWVNMKGNVFIGWEKPSSS